MNYCLFLAIFFAELDCVGFSGYGATTFPALTEAITFENNSTLAQDEATRLQVLIDKIAKTIKV